MNKRPFLTIGIPTWNRSTYLKKNLDALIQQIQANQLDSVEIFVSDNASTDETEKLCRDLTSQYAFFTYHRHPSNLGANVNFQTVLTAGHGEYIWMLGDDDLLADPCIAQVIKHIQCYLPDVIVGPTLFDDTQQKATHLSIQKITCTNNVIFADENLIELAGKISGLIFKKDSVATVIDFSEKIIQQTRTPWPHLVWFILLLSDPTKKLLLLPYGINQQVSQNWHNLLFYGKTLIQIHFIDYQDLIVALKPLITTTQYTQLISRTIAHRNTILFKSVIYGTYLDSYWELLRFAAGFYPRIVGIKNKLYYLLFLMLPLTLPNSIRQFLFQCATLLCPHEKLRKTIARVQQTKELLANSANTERQQYNEKQL